MTEELKYNLIGYSLAQDENKIQEKICISCLNKNVPFIVLSKCEHVKIFDILLDYKVSPLFLNSYEIELQWIF